MPTVQPIVVLDPGHGGSTAVGASSPDRSTGILSEKALTLDLARRVRALLAPSATVMLTRDSDANLSLAARAGFARLVNADLFVSLHFNAAPDPGLDSTEVYVGRSSTDGDRRLAQALYHEVSSALGTVGGVLAADLGVVARSRHLDRTSVALLEVCDVSNPRRGAELRDPATLDRVARAVAAALGARLAAAAGPPVVATAARGLGVDEDAATVLAGIKARAAAQALEPRGFTGTERFVRVLRDRYLPEYLAAPGPATATTAITRISAQNTSNVVTEVCGEPALLGGELPLVQPDVRPGAVRGARPRRPPRRHRRGHGDPHGRQPARARPHRRAVPARPAWHRPARLRGRAAGRERSGPAGGRRPQREPANALGDRREVQRPEPRPGPGPLPRLRGVASRAVGRFRPRPDQRHDRRGRRMDAGPGVALGPCHAGHAARGPGRLLHAGAALGWRPIAGSRSRSRRSDARAAPAGRAHPLDRADHHGRLARPPVPGAERPGHARARPER